jgi:hypothetical protein
MKFLNKSNGVTVNADKSPEKGLGYYNDYDAVVYTPKVIIPVSSFEKTGTSLSVVTFKIFPETGIL